MSEAFFKKRKNWIMLILFLVLAPLSFAQGSGRDPVRQSTSGKIAVSSLEDNKPILENFVRGLVVEIEIRDSVILRYKARVDLVEKMTNVHPGGSDLIEFVASREGTAIFSAFGSDEEINALEGFGIVKKKSRVIVANLPVPRPVDSLSVQFPDNKDKNYLGVSEAFSSFCEQYPRDVWCQPGQSLEP
jgi:hypothetical protein